MWPWNSTGTHSESSVATASLALGVQWYHKHGDVIVGHLPFPRGTVLLPLRAVDQHLGQLGKPAKAIVCFKGKNQETKASPLGELSSWK